MTTRISDELRQAIASHAGQPLHLEDPVTHAQYVILKLEDYEKLQESACDDSEVDPREAYPWVDQVMAADDLNDPSLESYQNLDGAGSP